MDDDYLIDEFWRAADRTLEEGAEAFEQVVKYYEEDHKCSRQEASGFAFSAVMVLYDDNGEDIHLDKTLPTDLIERGMNAIKHANNKYSL